MSKTTEQKIKYLEYTIARNEKLIKEWTSHKISQKKIDALEAKNEKYKSQLTELQGN